MNNINDFLSKESVGLEIEDLDDDESVDEIRQSMALSHYENRENIEQENNVLKIVANMNQQGGEVEVDDNNKLNQMEIEMPISPPPLELRQSLRVSLNRQSFGIAEMQQELKRLVLSAELQELLIKTIEQQEKIVDLIPLLVSKFEKSDKSIDFLLHLQKTIFISLIQHQELAKILSLSDIDSQNAKQLSKQYSALDNFCIKVDSKEDVNLKTVQLTLKYSSEQVFDEILSNCTKLFELILEDNQYVDYFNNIKIVHSKLKTIILIFPYASTFDKNDLFSFEKDDPQWVKLRKIAITKQLSDPKVLQESFKNIVKGVLLAHAMVAKGNEQNNVLTKHLYQNFGAIYYFVAEQKAKKKANIFFSEPRATTSKEVLNLMDKGLLKFGMSLAFPNIKYNKKIYISPVTTRITLSSILKEYSNNTINKIDEVKAYGNVKLEMLNEDEYYQNLFKKDPSKIRIRILSSQVLFRPDIGDRDSSDIDLPKKEKHIMDKFKSFFTPAKHFYDSVIIHIHGGGFVAMSSRCHQTYSRQWANSLDVPIFSIDYKKAPEFPYPEALDDVWQTYNWILHFISRFFNIKPKKVVLVGDSAGGNLVAALTLRCIKTGVRAPDGIVIVYPALNLNFDFFTPSLLLALDDQILPHAFLKLCLDSYVPSSLGLKANLDPFISPTYACDEMLKEFPPTRILAGTNDPLHDECWRFLKRLVELKKDVKMIVYEGMPHGFLNYDAPSGMKEAKVCVKDAGDMLKELLQYNQ